MVSISVVTPVYNSEKIISEFYFSLVKCLKKIGESYEIILINDCSDDKTKTKIQKIKNNRTFLINLKKNIGQHEAILKGLKKAKGNVIITLDSDMQDNPSYIYKIYSKYKKKQIIQMVDLRKKKDFRNTCSKIFWIILSFLSLKAFHLNPTNYLLFSKNDLKDLFKMKKNFIIYLDLIIINKKIEMYPGTKLLRKDKKTSYNIRKIILLAVKVLFHYSIIRRFSLI